MNYTKGNWTIKETSASITDPLFSHTDITSGGIRIAVAVGIGSDESRANASLIAAAPDMYEALKEIKEYCAEYAEENGLEDNAPMWAFISDAQSAIFKAEGK